LTRVPLVQLTATVTPTVMVQEPCAGIEPPLRDTEVLPLFAVRVPPHVVAARLPET
jgi:hypothetical protein